ncbi:unnamed protein product, partial [Owenia fusiformis]
KDFHVNFLTYVNKIYSKLISMKIQIHIVFDIQESELITPKIIERNLRDSGAVDITRENITETDILPSNFDTFLKNRRNKRLFVNFFGETILKLHSNNPSSPISMFVSGCFSDPTECFSCFKGNVSKNDLFSCNIDEGDSRIWFHVSLCEEKDILIFSKDTDSFMIGLPHISNLNKNIFINIGGSKAISEVFIHMNILFQNISNDYSLQSMDASGIGRTIQTVFISSGCDYVSSFKGFSKSFVFETFFKNCDFICGKDSVKANLGSLCNTSCEDSDLGFLAFMRLIVFFLLDVNQHFTI